MAVCEIKLGLKKICYLLELLNEFQTKQNLFFGDRVKYALDYLSNFS